MLWPGGRGDHAQPHTLGCVAPSLHPCSQLPPPQPFPSQHLGAIMAKQGPGLPEELSHSWSRERVICHHRQPQMRLSDFLG